MVVALFRFLVQEKNVKTKSDKKTELPEKVSKKSKSKTKGQKDEKKEEVEEKEMDGDSSVELDKTWSDQPCIVVQHSLHNGSDEEVLDKVKLELYSVSSPLIRTVEPICHKPKLNN